MNAAPGFQQAPSVLVVEADAEVRDVLRLVLECDGFDAVEASSEAEAVACVLRQHFEFIVLDHVMPGMKVDNLAAVLRCLAPEGRIVAFSASSNERPPKWADAYLNRTRLGEVPNSLSALLSLTKAV